MRMNSRGLAALAGAVLCAGAANAEIVWATTQQGFLISFDSATPGTIISGVGISGMQANETVLGIDFRPATGEMYALGSFSRLYQLNQSTGAATQVGGQFSTMLNGSNFGFDFNPTVDRIRVVSNANQNLRLNPNTGAVASVDGSLAYAMGDSGFGMDPDGVHAAYTNNFAGATSTTLYVLDTDRDVLARQAPPNDGVLNTIGFLGANIGELGGFDISGATGSAFVAVRDIGLSTSTFWSIDLATGQAMMVGQIGGGEIITAMALRNVPTPATATLLGLGLLGVGRRRR